MHRHWTMYTPCLDSDPRWRFTISDFLEIRKSHFEEILSLPTSNLSDVTHPQDLVASILIESAKNASSERFHGCIRVTLIFIKIDFMINITQGFYTIKAFHIYATFVWGKTFILSQVVSRNTLNVAIKSHRTHFQDKTNKTIQDIATMCIFLVSKGR